MATRKTKSQLARELNKKDPSLTAQEIADRLHLHVSTVREALLRTGRRGRPPRAPRVLKGARRVA